MEIKLVAKSIEAEIEWFQKLLETSLNIYFQNSEGIIDVKEIDPPNLKKSQGVFAQFILEYQLGFEERLILILSLIPKLKSNALDMFLIKNQNTNSEFSEFEGVKDATTGRFIPTLGTACFILSGNNMAKKFEFLNRFNSSHFFFKKGIINHKAENEFVLSQELYISAEYFGYFTTGKPWLPEYSKSFPAKQIETQLDWSDLIVSNEVTSRLLEINDWLKYSPTILDEWGLHKNLKAGFRALFHGTSGTGKTLAATLLGKSTNRPVFRVDLSMVVSKYIGETEKNLGALFDIAEHKHWILFFDEADALFGKRTQTKGANDRYANQEVAYLLQRIEDFSGLVILATNITSNIDDAFSRRFQSIIHFPKPDAKSRKMLWNRMFKEQFQLDSHINFDDIAEKYELTGGGMINILRYCALEAAKRGKKKILLVDIMTGIRREYRKQNKTV